jgi:hypothetical protein
VSGLANDHAPNKNGRRRDALPLFCFSFSLSQVS